MMFDDLSPYYRHSISTIHTHFFFEPLYKNGLEKENEFSKKEIAKPYVSPSKGSENTLSEIILNSAIL